MKLVHALLATACAKRLSLAQLSADPIVTKNKPSTAPTDSPPVSTPVGPPASFGPPGGPPPGLESFDLEGLADGPGGASNAFRGSARGSSRGGFKDWGDDEFHDCDYGEPSGGSYFDTDQYSAPTCVNCGCFDHDCDCDGEDCDCDDLNCENVCDFVPEVEECILEDLIGQFPPGGPGNPGNGDENSGELGSAAGSITSTDETNVEQIPDVREDIYQCTNIDHVGETGNKSCYSGCKKKIFELSGKICVQETQSGGLCEGLKEVGDGAQTKVTNVLKKVNDGGVEGDIGAGLCPPGCIQDPGVPTPLPEV